MDYQLSVISDQLLVIGYIKSYICCLCSVVLFRELRVLREQKSNVKLTISEGRLKHELNSCLQLWNWGFMQDWI